MISLKDVVLNRGTRTLLNGASLTINPGEKVALVGRNGAGKSSLFALLAGTLQEDGGSYQIPPHWRMAQVAQQMPDTEESATQFVMAGDIPLMRARDEVQAAEDSGDGERMAHAYSALYDAGEQDAPARAQSLILGLGFQIQDMDQPVNSFSGGWRMRLQLARALMCPSELLLLDEPTNHLDLDALIWVENWLKKYPGTMLVISHDREFLDAVTQVTVHMEQAQLTRYGGNYSTFETLRAERMALQQSAFERQQEKIAHLQQFIARFKAKASKAKQAQSRVKALGRMEKLAPLLAEADFTFEFFEPEQLPNPMLTLHAADLGYAATSTVVVRQVALTVLAGQRIGILGANGQGKSTLVKTIARVLQPLQGDVVAGKGLRIGYFAQQEMDLLDPGATPLEHLVRLAKQVLATGRAEGLNTREQALKNFLGLFNFGGERLTQPVGTLSGGERARLVLCLIVWQRPNLLLLDEPTNHLDLATREALSMALNEFEGTVLLVSHDRALLREVCDEFWLVAQGRLMPFDGDLEDYQRYLLEESRRKDQLRRQRDGAASLGAVPAAAKPAGASAKPARSSAARSGTPLRKQLERIESEMASLNAEQQHLQGRLAGPLPPPELRVAGQRLSTVEQRLQQLESDWLELSVQLEV